ncbi:MAG TPA: hypothetical protein VMT88_09330 [Actinomycetes bacterium]|nr:hypothetical protein [Actinomycetes bacterium]
MRLPANSLAGSSLGLLVGKLLQMGGGFIFWIAAARTASTTTVGVTAAMVSGLMLCVQIALLGVGAATTILIHRHNSAEPSAHHRTIDDAVSFVLLSGAAVGAAYVGIAVWVTQGNQTLASDPGVDLLFIVASAFATVGVLLDQVSLAFSRGWQSTSRYLASVALPIAIVWVIALQGGKLSAADLFLAWSIGTFVAVGVGALQLRRSRAYHYRPRFALTRMRNLARIGFPMQLLTLVERAPALLVPVLVSVIVSPTTTALWYAAWMAAWAIFTAPVAVGLAHFAEIVKDPGSAAQRTSEAIRSALLFGGILGMVALVAAPQILGLLGPQYAEQSATALRILVLGLLPFTLVQSYDAVCRAQSRLKEAVTVGMVGGTILLSSVLLAAPHGLTPMAWAWVIGSIPWGTCAAIRIRQLLGSASHEVPPPDHIRNTTKSDVDLLRGKS